MTGRRIVLAASVFAALFVVSTSCPTKGAGGEGAPNEPRREAPQRLGVLFLRITSHEGTLRLHGKRLDTGAVVQLALSPAVGATAAQLEREGVLRRGQGLRLLLESASSTPVIVSIRTRFSADGFQTSPPIGTLFAFGRTYCILRERTKYFVELEYATAEHFAAREREFLLTPFSHVEIQLIDGTTIRGAVSAACRETVTVQVGKEFRVVPRETIKSVRRARRNGDPPAEK